MADLTEADRYLLAQISSGNPEGWSGLVTRYQGRLLAFARGRLGRKAEAEDLVQDTFVAFLQNIKNFKQDQSVETYLFTILRRRIIDLFRGRHSRTCLISEATNDDDSSTFSPPGAEMTASWYARREERDDRVRSALAQALEHLIDRYRQSENFRDLKIIEMLFFAQMRNKDIGPMVGLDEKAIALIKHRALKEIRDHVLKGGLVLAEDWESADTSASLLTQVWESQRLTCPKRSTIGRFVLGTLEDDWKTYVEFHVMKLGCHFCRANLDDLRKQTEDQATAVHNRVMQSTVGFFKHA